MTKHVILSVLACLATMTFICSCDDSATIPSNGEKVRIPTDGLVAYYPFTDDASDESGRDNDGKLYGATIYSIKSGFRTNWACDFDGVDDYVEVAGSESLDLDSAVSLAVWFKLEHTAYWQALVKKGRYPGTAVYWLLVHEPNGL